MIVTDLFESHQTCPKCGGPAFSDLVLAEKKDACYSKVRSRYKVWPSAYASGALVQCRKKGAANWGNKSEGVAEDDDGKDKFYYQRNNIWRVMDGDELVHKYTPDRYEVVGAKKLLSRFDDEGYDVTHVISPMGVVTYLYGKPEDEGVAEGLVGDVVVHNYTKIPIDLEPGQAQIAGWGPNDEPLYRVKGQDGKEVKTWSKRRMLTIAKEQGVAEGSLEEVDRRGFLKGMGAAAVAGTAGKANAKGLWATIPVYTDSDPPLPRTVKMAWNYYSPDVLTQDDKNNIVKLINLLYFAKMAPEEWRDSQNGRIIGNITPSQIYKKCHELLIFINDSFSNLDFAKVMNGQKDKLENLYKNDPDQFKKLQEFFFKNWETTVLYGNLLKRKLTPTNESVNQGVAEGSLEELSTGLLQRAAQVAKDKRNKAMDPKIHNALGGGYMNPLAKHYDTVSQKLSNKAAKAGQQDAIEKIASPAVMRKMGMSGKGATEGVAEAGYGHRNPDLMSPGDYDRYQQDQMDHNKRDFKRREHEAEWEQEKAYSEKLAARDAGTWYIRINGKLLKDRQGQPYTFQGKAAANRAAATMMAKPFNAGKQFTLTTTAADRT
jgi:hypothetical protein